MWPQKKSNGQLNYYETKSSPAEQKSPLHQNKSYMRLHSKTIHQSKI